MKLTEKQIKAIESQTDWTVQVNDDDSYFLENYSPAGGEMVIEADSVESILSYCDDFDPEEEFGVWYGANRGEPSNPGYLWEDCLEQQKMYTELAEIIRNN